MSSDEEQIDGLKRVAMRSVTPDARKKAIDTLAVYGKKAIPAITDVIKDSLSTEVRDYGLDMIKKIKGKQ